MNGIELGDLPPSPDPGLLTAVRHADQLMQRIKGTGKVTGNERIAVMAAVQLASELLSLQAPSEGATGGLALGEFKRRIDLMNSMLDEAETGQDRKG